MNKQTFLALVLSSLPPPAAPQVRPGQTLEECLTARKQALVETLDLTYPDEELPVGLARAYKVAADGVVLPPIGDKTYHGIAGRKETAAQLAGLCDPQEVGSLTEIADLWERRGGEIEATPPVGKHPAAVAAICATLRREARALREFLAAMTAS